MMSLTMLSMMWSPCRWLPETRSLVKRLWPWWRWKFCRGDEQVKSCRSGGAFTDPIVVFPGPCGAFTDLTMVFLGNYGVFTDLTMVFPGPCGAFTDPTVVFSGPRGAFREQQLLGDVGGRLAAGVAALLLLLLSSLVLVVLWSVRRDLVEVEGPHLGSHPNLVPHLAHISIIVDFI